MREDGIRINSSTRHILHTTISSNVLMDGFSLNGVSENFVGLKSALHWMSTIFSWSCPNLLFSIKFPCCCHSAYELVSLKWLNCVNTFCWFYLLVQCASIIVNLDVYWAFFCFVFKTRWLTRLKSLPVVPVRPFKNIILLSNFGRESYTNG